LEEPTEVEAQNANFFDRLAEEEAAEVAEEQAEDIFAEDHTPAYQPQPAYRPQPQARVAGQPSPETLDRLKRAVNKVPEAAEYQPRQAAPIQAPQPVAEPRPRFGINSLINRMSGHAAAERQPEFQRRQPPVQQYDEDVDNYPQEDDRVEIPAFLRRQAN